MLVTFAVPWLFTEPAIIKPSAPLFDIASSPIFSTFPVDEIFNPEPVFVIVNFVPLFETVPFTSNAPDSLAKVALPFLLETEPSI